MSDDAGESRPDGSGESRLDGSDDSGVDGSDGGGVGGSDGADVDGSDDSGVGGSEAARFDAGESRLDRLAPLLSGVRFGQFASVGVVGAIFDNVTLASLRLGLGVPEMLAKAAGVEVAILVMFAVNERWTFAGQGRPGRLPLLRRLGKSHLVRSGGVAVQLAVYWVLTQQLTVTLELFGRDLWFLAASPVAIGVAMMVNYCAESVFTWKVHEE